MSLPEVLLWRELRKRPDGFKWRKQHPAGPFSLDFTCLEARLVIEIDGEAHDRGSNPARDEARDEWLMAQGYRTWRVPAREVLADLDAVVRMAVELARQCQPLHRPPGGPPPLTGEDL
jgi:very-short-patch-repair endonuclease